MLVDSKQEIEKWVSACVAAILVTMPHALEEEIHNGGIMELIVSNLSLLSLPGNLQVTMIFEPTDKAS